VCAKKVLRQGQLILANSCMHVLGHIQAGVFKLLCCRSTCKQVTTRSKAIRSAALGGARSEIHKQCRHGMLYGCDHLPLLCIAAACNLKMHRFCKSRAIHAHIYSQTTHIMCACILSVYSQTTHKLKRHGAVQMQHITVRPAMHMLSQIMPKHQCRCLPQSCTAFHCFPIKFP
jgi:hypothetical protein